MDRQLIPRQAAASGSQPARARRHPTRVESSGSTVRSPGSSPSGRSSRSASSAGSVGRAAAPLRPDRVRDPVPAHRPRHDRRLPPALHAPLFKTSRAMRGVLAALGSAAIEGPIISWVADHRKHHAFSDPRATRTAPTSITASAARRATRARPRARRLAVHPHPARLARALRAGPARRPGRVVRGPHVLRVDARRSRRLVRARLRDRRHVYAGLTAFCGAAPCGCSCCTT